MKQKLLQRLFWVLLFVMTAGYASAQIKITGKVVSDADSAPLVGASIIEKGTQNGTMTDNNGVFKMSVKNRQAVILISYVGMETVQQEVGNRTLFTIRMHDNQELEEVMVIGYGQVKKSDATGSSLFRKSRRHYWSPHSLVQ